MWSELVVASSPQGSERRPRIYLIRMITTVLQGLSSQSRRRVHSSSHWTRQQHRHLVFAIPFIQSSLGSNVIRESSSIGEDFVTIFAMSVDGFIFLSALDLLDRSIRPSIGLILLLFACLVSLLGFHIRLGDCFPK